MLGRERQEPDQLLGVCILFFHSHIFQRTVRSPNAWPASSKMRMHDPTGGDYVAPIFTITVQ
ncbi:hypothetical protein PGQ11_009282 [Apiospora arundinis]|uniref:Uncharacterized protein n=1 Tax=Apiospora arundinis TaxID=335852 RepID=A0ABR2IHK6_9PEZI